MRRHVATGDEMVMPLPMMTTDPPIGRLVKDAPGLHHHMPTPRSLIVACACGHAIGVTVFAITSFGVASSNVVNGWFADIQFIDTAWIRNGYAVSS
jgi:hypothetical protein